MTQKSHNVSTKKSLNFLTDEIRVFPNFCCTLFYCPFLQTSDIHRENFLVLCFLSEWLFKWDVFLALIVKYQTRKKEEKKRMIFIRINKNFSIKGNIRINNYLNI